MSALLLAEFREPESLLGAARRAKAARYRLVDVFSPFPVGGTAELLGSTSTRLRAVMFIGGFAVAACAYLTEVWSAVFNYPIDSGSRPLHSWPAFVLFPFAIGIFGAALAGLIGFFVQTGLPRLHHPLFAVGGFERVSQDRFMLALERPADDLEADRLGAWLQGAGAVKIWNVLT